VFFGSAVALSFPLFMLLSLLAIAAAVRVCVMIDSKFSIQYKVLNSMRYDRFELYCTVALQYSSTSATVSP
jgi:hypothetical protein